MEHNNSQSASYAAAGVDITAGYKAVELMKTHIARTRNLGCLDDVGGFGGCFGHGYGHSLGLEIHENPSPNASNVEPLLAGVVCSAEPGIYLPGKFGVRIEDVTIITEEGCEDITGSPKNLIII